MWQYVIMIMITGTVDHGLLIQSLLSVAVDQHVLSWFQNSLIIIIIIIIIKKKKKSCTQK